MEEEQTIEEPKVEKAGTVKLVIIIVSSVLVTALVVAIGFYLWQQQELKVSEQGLQKTIESLQAQNGQNSSELQDEIVELRNIWKYRMVSSDCSQEECLFDIDNGIYPLGIAAVKGYYLPLERTGWGGDKTCDSFVVTGGSEVFASAFVSLVDSGNTVQSKNELNQPIINLALDTVDSADREKVLNSTENAQIKLVALNSSPQQRAAPVCFSFIDILKVQ